MGGPLRVLLNVSFSTSTTLRPSRCFLLRLASGPTLLTGIPHLNATIKTRHIGTRRCNPRRVHPYRICSDAAHPRCIKRGQCRTRCDIRYEVEKAQRMVNYDHGFKHVEVQE